VFLKVFWKDEMANPVKNTEALSDQGAASILSLSIAFLKQNDFDSATVFKRYPQRRLS